MKKNKKIILTLFITLLTIFCISGTVEASYSASGKTVKSGASVSITITSTEKLENFDVACTDTGGLTYNSCSTSVVGAIANSSGKKISYAMYGGEATNLGTYTFTAPKVTEETKFSVKFIVNDETIVSTITVEPEKTNNTGTTNNNTGSNNSGSNTGSNSGTTNNNSGSTNNGSTNNNSGTSSSGNSGTTTEQPKAKSTNAYLSTLGVRPAEYDFSNFSKTKYEYSVTVPNDVNSLQVLYKAADSKAKVKVTGNSGFEVGSNNEIKIIVTAEDGKATKTYKIKVTKLAAEEEKPGNIIEDEEGVYLTSLELEGLELSPAFAKDTYSYTATLDKDITEIKVNAVANKEKANVEISGNTDLAIGENTINILVKQEDSLAQTVYQITLTKEAISSETPEVQEDNFMDDIVGSVNKYVIVAAGLVLLMIITVIILIILLRKENKRLKNEETEEYDVYQNDEKEFENKEVTDEEVKDETNETETKNERRKSRRREKGRHSK